MMHANQKFIAAQSVTAACFALFVTYLTKTRTLPLARDFSQVLSEGERLTYAFRCLVFSVVPLFYASLNVARVRLRNPTNLAAHPSAPVPPSMETFKIYERILQNTVEQTILHIIAVLALVSCLEVDQLWLIPLLVLLFVVARAAFFIGYVASPLYRAFGFSLTAMPTTCSLAYAMITITLGALA